MYNVFYGGSKVVYIPSTSDTLLETDHLYTNNSCWEYTPSI